MKIDRVRGLLEEKADETTILNALYSSPDLDDILSVSTDLSSIRRSEVIIAVSNSDSRLIQTKFVRHRAILCDVSVPCATSDEVIQIRGDVLYFTGGIVKLPCGEEMDLPGFPLPSGHVFACMAETMILGLSGVRENLSYGKLKPRHIEWVEGLAEYHGFQLSALKPHALSQWGSLGEGGQAAKKYEISVGGVA